MKLKGQDELQSSPVVANSTMNREREVLGTNSYAADLKLDLLEALSARVHASGGASWLDLCCATGRALIQASEEFARRGLGAQVEILGVDLVSMFHALPAGSLQPRLIEANLETWEPRAHFDLVTCVHGLHYLGDKLGLLRRALAWLKPEGLFLAHLDLANLRLESGKRASRSVLPSLRAAGVSYDSRRRIVRAQGPRDLSFALEYLGADDQAGPNFTGQPAVNSVYRPT